MKNTILTNRIDLRLCYPAISGYFQIVQIKADGKDKSSYGKTVNQIYEKLSPISLAKTEEGTYVALQKKGCSFKFENESLTHKLVSPESLSTICLARLLIGALPTVLDGSSRPSEGVGLFYLVDIETVNKVDVLRAIQIKLEMDHSDNIALKLDAATFTPMQYHTNKEGKLHKNCVHLPRFHYCDEDGSIRVSKKGGYLKKKHHRKKMRSDMVSLDTKYPSKYWKSKMGVLDTFISDLEKSMSKFISIQFHELPQDFRLRFKENDIQKLYSDIDCILRTQRFNVVNYTVADVSPLIDCLENDGFHVIKSSEIEEGCMNIAIHHSKEYYEENNHDDPYLNIRTNRDIAIQSVAPDNIIKNGLVVKAVYEACKKELLIKFEVLERKLKLVELGGNWLFAICKVADKIPSFECLELVEGNHKYYSLDVESAHSSFLEDIPATELKNGLHIVIELDSKKSFIIEETKLVALPQFKELSQIMRELERGYDLGVQRQWISEFIQLSEDGKICLSNKEKVLEKLKNLLSTNQFQKNFYKDDFFKSATNKFSYRGGYQVFFDWIHSAKGVRMGASIKSRSNNYIEAGLGLFYSNEEKMYFVGDKDNLKSLPKFCRIRRIIANNDDILTTQKLLEMMNVFHIRHRQGTILPFPFKHLREFFDSDSRYSNTGVDPS